MSDYSRCPSCDHKPEGISVSHMDIFQCGKCGQKYCHKCHGSNGGRQCPECSSTSYRIVGTCYAK
jgi:hypothetical protein